MNNMIPSESQIWVPEVLSDEQVTFFIENGYLAVSNLVSSDEVEELRTDTTKLARGGYPCETLEPVDSKLSDQDVLASILCILQPIIRK